MKTPIADFVREYAQQSMTRFHMPGHKGKSFLGCENYDITEVTDADALYEAKGIIAESEQNATKLFATKKTLYSTEGSSQCIKAMLYLAMNYAKTTGRKYVIAARNVHKSFLYGAALLDLDVVWLWPDEMHSLCSCNISANQLDEELQSHKEKPIAVYITNPDYLGNQIDVKAIAQVCHKYGTILIVDNAHGAYLHFLKESQHPIDLGADLCCDSAHKTLPVLTGGAYLQISNYAAPYFAMHAKQAMALFGSTSPSYLILSSLDLCNSYLNNGYRDKLDHKVLEIKTIKEKLIQNGWKIEETDPLKITIRATEQQNGYEIARILRRAHIECEYADENFVVCMLTLENSLEELNHLVECLDKNLSVAVENPQFTPVKTKQIQSIREALFSDSESIAVESALGRVCGAPLVSCPPAIPIVISGELINKEAIDLLIYYGIEEIEVLKNR